MKGMKRKKLPTRDMNVNVRMTKDEYDQLDAVAYDEGLTSLGAAVRLLVARRAQRLPK